MPSSTSLSSASASASSSGIPSLGGTSTDKRTTIVAIVLCVLGIIAIGIIMIWTYRFKPRSPLNASSPMDNDTAALNRKRTRATKAAPRAHIIPFGSEAPRFKHSPGQGMRIAQRGADGSWNFSESTTSLIPKGVKDLDHTPSPISPSDSSHVISPISPAKLADTKSSDWRLSLGLSSEDFDIHPPPAYNPAYRKDYVGYIDHDKK